MPLRNLITTIQRISVDRASNMLSSGAFELTEVAYAGVSGRDVILEIAGTIVDDNYCRIAADEVRVVLSPEQAMFILGRLLTSIPKETLNKGGIDVVFEPKKDTYEF